MDNKAGQIYMIENMIDHKVYIGQTKHDCVFTQRYNYNIRRNTNNPNLIKAIDQYGLIAFRIYTICWCDTPEQLDEQEKYYIDKYHAIDPAYGYNIGIGGHNPEWTDRQKKTLSVSSKQWWIDHPEYRQKKSEENRGKNNFLVKLGGHTDESKEKMRQIRKQMIADGRIDIMKAQRASLTPEARHKRAISVSKYIYIQYDLNMNEIKRWHTLKDMYDDIVAQGIENYYASYRSFKLKRSQQRVFEEHMYKDKGYYFKKIAKHANTEIT